MDKRIMTTLTSYPGYEVEEDLGIIFAFDKDFVPFRNLWQMDDALERTYDLLWQKAVRKGANAVLGINMCLAPEKSLPVLMGTAVILKSTSAIGKD
ncbi:MAG: hypothetical protein IKG15_04965 [Solobacterium sp.]|nr:hypothetical protein [Solobacterium sp.]